MPQVTIRVPAGCGTNIVGVIFAVPLLFGLALGVWGLHVQHWKLRNYVPVQAVVLDVGLDSESSSRGGTVYEPMVRYEYQVRGRVYESRQVLPVEYRAGQKWAERLADRFKPGQTVTAYHHPDDPAQAFLVRERGGVMVWWIVVPFTILAAGVYLSRSSRE